MPPSAALTEFHHQFHQLIEASPPALSDSEHHFVFAGDLFARYDTFLQELAKELNDRSHQTIVSAMSIATIMLDPNQRLRPQNKPLMLRTSVR